MCIRDRDPSYLEGKTVELKVIKVDKQRNNVVVSRKAVVETEFSEERNQLLENIKEGSKAKGIIKNLTDYGAFIDLGGIDGLLHITDMAWKRVKNPSEIVGIGDEIEVKVLKFDSEKKRVSLGLKQMGDDPWLNLTKRYPEGENLSGKVTSLADYGCFVELEEGIDGLVYISDLSWTKKIKHPSELFSIGDKIDVIVLELDVNERKLSLGHKQTKKNPWDDYLKKYPVDSTHKFKLESVGERGASIFLNDEISAFVPKKHAVKEDGSSLKEGEEAEFKVCLLYTSDAADE